MLKLWTSQSVGVNNYVDLFFVKRTCASHIGSQCTAMMKKTSAPSSLFLP